MGLNIALLLYYTIDYMLGTMLLAYYLLYKWRFTYYSYIYSPNNSIAVRSIYDIDTMSIQSAENPY